jgi:iron complex transport system substrate-binding protein
VKRTALALVAALTLLAACGDTSSDTAADADDAAGDSTADTATSDAPERIVSLSPSATETLFAIGAGDQVRADDSMSNIPPEAPDSDLSANQPNVEAIASNDPDLVVVDGTDPELVDGLEAIDFEVLEAPAPASLDDLYAQIEEIGAATGHADEADRLAADMAADIEAALAQLPERDEALTYYHELDDTLYSVTSETFLGNLYAMAGLENIADAADPDGTSGGYPQLSAEYLVDADPDLVFLADAKCCGQTAATFAARPGFGGLRAVAGGDVVLLDDDVASRWGPRVVDLLTQIVNTIVAADGAETAAA